MSLSVLIVDDEILIREGLKKHINWDSLNLKVIGTAKSANTALAICQDQAPDILITDICMQNKDGFSLIEDLLKMGICPQVILISSYDEFAYAQKAIRLEVVREYVLKPIETDALTALLVNLRDSIENDRQSQSAGQKEPQFDPGEYRRILSQMRTDGYDTHRLIQNMKAGDREHALAVFAPAATLLIKPETSTETVKRFCSGLLMSLFTDGIMNTAHNYNPVEQLEQMTGSKEIINFMTRVITAECGRISHQNRTFKSKLIETCLKVIDQEYCNPGFNLTTMAAELNVTPNYLSVRFKEETGMGFVKYLLNKQMGRAQVLLTDPTLKIYEVSALVGFEDEKYFSRQFKRIVDISPKEYRNRNGGAG
ncbi:MAG: response regulator transcription factor [Lachnospiraceae bacterium]